MFENITPKSNFSFFKIIHTNCIIAKINEAIQDLKISFKEFEEIR